MYYAHATCASHFVGGVRGGARTVLAWRVQDRTIKRKTTDKSEKKAPFRKQAKSGAGTLPYCVYVVVRHGRRAAAHCVCVETPQAQGAAHEESVCTVGTGISF